MKITRDKFLLVRPFESEMEMDQEIEAGRASLLRPDPGDDHDGPSVRARHLLTRRSAHGLPPLMAEYGCGAVETAPSKSR